MRGDKHPLHERVRVVMPATKKGLTLMSRAGYWVNKDGSVSRRRRKATAKRAPQAPARGADAKKA